MSSERPYQPSANNNAQAGNRITFAGDYDPRVLLVPSLRGGIFFRLDKTGLATLEIFRKLDNDTSSFNWEIITGSLPGPPGPPGLPGPPGPPGTGSDLYNADLSVQIGDVVYVSGSNLVAPAIGNDINKKYGIGIAISKPSANEADIQSVGKTSALFTGLTPGLPVFLSPTTLGGVTQMPPIGANIWRQILGVAASAEEIHLLIQEPIGRR